jgi:hypothetical protein
MKLIKGMKISPNLDNRHAVSNYPWVLSENPVLRVCVYRRKSFLNKIGAS